MLKAEMLWRFGQIWESCLPFVMILLLCFLATWQSGGAFSLFLDLLSSTKSAQIVPARITY
jgi:hypothetical protein